MPPDGFPNSTNTGPAAGTVFQEFKGVFEVRQDNAVINGLRVTGAISVYANNVTIENCEINATGELWGIAQVSGSGLFEGQELQNLWNSVQDRPQGHSPSHGCRQCG
jgi:hypothetical protein